MGSTIDGSSSGKNNLIVTDESAIIGKTKINRKTDDGTTLVFYSFADEDKAKNITDGDDFIYTSGNEKTIVHKAYNISPVNDAVRDGFKNAFNQIEAIADIKYFNIDNLSKEDRAYFETHTINGKKIEPPASADFVIFRATGDTIDFNGRGGTPRKDDNEPSQKVTIPKDYSEDPARAAKLLSTILHENLHTLGFMHSFQQEGDGGKPYLDRMKDNRGNTVMSYNFIDNCGTDYYPQTYQELDVAALQKQYGVSKHFDPGLWKKLAQEENMRMALATSELTTYWKNVDIESHVTNSARSYNSLMMNELFEIKNDHKMTKKEVKELFNLSDECEKKFMNEEDVKYITENYPKTSNFKLTKVDGKKHGYIMSYDTQQWQKFESVYIELDNAAIRTLKKLTHSKDTNELDLNMLLTSNNKGVPIKVEDVTDKDPSKSK